MKKTCRYSSSANQSRYDSQFLDKPLPDPETTLYEEKFYEMIHSAADKEFPSKDILTILSLTSDIRPRDSRGLERELFFQ